jgi:Type IV pilin-like G and H, putative
MVKNFKIVVLLPIIALGIFGGYLTYQQYLKSEAENILPAQSEGKSLIGSINRAQRALFFDKQKFAKSLVELNIGIRSETKNFIYVIKLITPTNVQSSATSRIDGLVQFVGGVTATLVESEDTLLATLCQSDQPAKTPPPEMIFKDGVPPICPEGYSIVK